MDKKKKFSKYPRERRSDYMDNTMYDNHASGPNNEGDPDIRIGLQARSQLPKSTFGIKADPYEAALPNANPYDLIAPFNKAVGGQYAGADNLDGGNIQQYANSVNSKTLQAFDFARLKLAINYRFMPRLLANEPTDPSYDRNYIGAGLIDMQRQSIAEATSILSSTTFTQMAINNYAVETDLPVGEAEYTTVGQGDNQKLLLEDLPDVIYAACSYYQLFWQEALSVVSWLNSFRLKQGTMIRSSWNRETPTLNAIFGLFNKKAFLSLVDSVCLSFEGEYIDREWMEQFNLLTSMPSRRTNSIHDAVLEIQARHQHPNKFRLHVLDEAGAIVDSVFSEEDLNFTDPDNNDATITFWDACEEIKDLLSAENMMYWARNSQYRATFRQNKYYNRVVALLDLIQSSCTLMKIKFNDIREVFDVLARTGLNTWVKKYRPSITKSTDAALFDNLIINDIYKTVFSGATEIKIDPSTKRWRSFTFWDLYDGVPSYDARSGGCFLTFSGKTIESGEDADYIRKWVPITFYIDSTSTTVAGQVPLLKAVNRSGNQINIVTTEVTMANDPYFARLVPLSSQANYKVRVPTLASAASAVQAAQVGLFMTNVFGYGKVEDKTYFDPDLLYVYEIEIADVTNDAICYARVNAPFRGAEPSKDIIGFQKFGQQ